MTHRTGLTRPGFAATGLAFARRLAAAAAIVLAASPLAHGADPKVLNIFMLRFVPGFPILDNNSAAGLAFLDGNGLAMWSGPNLFGFTGGREVIAAVLAHELGHNLGLDHSGADENLMNSGGDGERLDLGEIATARSSGFLVVIPEPASALLLFVAATSLAATRRRR